MVARTKLNIIKKDPAVGEILFSPYSRASPLHYIFRSPLIGIAIGKPYVTTSFFPP